jgi:hypothetical protein
MRFAPRAARAWEMALPIPWRDGKREEVVSHGDMEGVLPREAPVTMASLPTRGPDMVKFWELGVEA